MLDTGDVRAMTGATIPAPSEFTTTFRSAHRPSPYPKRVLDMVVSSLALVPLAPLLVVAAIAVRVSSRGPIFFRQERVGYRGKLFTIWKFRTMRAGSDDSVHRAYVRAMLAGGENGRHGRMGLHKLDDDRVTRVGRVLRRTSVDELPQLFNVLRGDMSLVGPRPVLPWEAELFSQSERLRFDVRPGITGLWQVSGRSRLTMRQALELDCAYVVQQRFLLDVKILLKTIPVVLRARDAA